LNLTSEKNDYIGAFWAWTVPPFGGTSSPPCTIWILLMNEGAAASLPRLYYLNSLNEWRGCCLPPRMGFTLI
jgi:hypothetical protein